MRPIPRMKGDLWRRGNTGHSDFVPVDTSINDASANTQVSVPFTIVGAGIGAAVGAASGFLAPPRAATPDSIAADAEMVSA